MKILLIGSTAFNSGDASLLLKRAFEKEGCQVRFLSTTDDRPLVSNLLFRALNHRNDRVISEFSRLVFAVAKQWQPDIVFLYGSNLWVSAKTIRDLQKRLGCKVIMWEVNNGCFKDYQAASIPFYDHVFVLDSYLVPVLQVTGARRVHHISPCIDQDEHYSVQLSQSDRQRFGSDISLLGAAYPTRVEIAKTLTEYDLKLYGSGWRRDPVLKPFASEYPVLDLTKLKIFSASKISLNIHGSHMIHGENFRVFEVAACGGVSFSLPKPDLLRCFAPDAEVVIFENIGDLHKKIKYYLANPDKLQKIGESAKIRVLADHTYAHRVRTILDILSD